jgi:hypothetical protein
VHIPEFSGREVLASLNHPNIVAKRKLKVREMGLLYIRGHSRRACTITDDQQNRHSVSGGDAIRTPCVDLQDPGYQSGRSTCVNDFHIKPADAYGNRTDRFW